MAESSPRHVGGASPAFVPLAGQFRRRLKALRENRGWSIRQLEQETGIGHSILGRYESGSRPNPTLAHLVRLQEVFGLNSMEELFGEVTVSCPSARTLGLREPR